MLDINFIRENPDKIRTAIKNKQVNLDLDRLLEVDQARRSLTQEIEALRQKRNSLSSSIPKLKGDERENAIQESKTVGQALKADEEKIQSIEAEFKNLMLFVPGVPAPEVPVGTGEKDNIELRKWGEARKFDFTPKDHLELALSLGLVNFDGPRQYAGSRSYALTGDGVLLELAVLQLALNHVIRKGFTAVSPPILVKETAMQGTGFFPLHFEESYAIEKDELFLTGTSEVGLVSLHMDQILSEEELPIRYAGISDCFRREAGAAGRDTKGLYRVHHFQKVEQVVICHADPEASLKEHMLLLQNSEEILQALELPHRIALACSVELGLGQIRKHEVETWMPSRQTYSETHSCSTLHDFQARRSKIRYKTESGKNLHCYTLNNTAIASPRILIPILETYQNKDGSVTIPKALRQYMNGREIIEPKK
ncbi:MAG: serine--tRNA ligase [Myxococcota bacterium]|nr:serine--tRNA ligase [Myxococcota bacterium]